MCPCRLYCTKGSGYYDQRADIYSLTVLINWILTGRDWLVGVNVPVILELVRHI